MSDKKKGKYKSKGSYIVMVDKPVIAIKAENGKDIPVFIINKGDSFKYAGIPNIKDGTYKWTATGKIAITGDATKEIITLNGSDVSGSKDDSELKVEYTVKGKTVSANIKITVIKIEIAPLTMHATESLDSNEFEAKVTPSAIPIASYKWLHSSADGSWPATSGNTPQLKYDKPTKKKTKIIKTRWFAKTPDRLYTVDGPKCSYNIYCKLTIDGKEYKAPTPAILKVEVENFSGECNWPSFDKWVTITIAKKGGVWKVTGKGSFSRKAPVVKVNTLKSSQFYNKLLAHENLHVTQWTTQDPWKALFDAGTLYNNTLRHLTSNISEADLRAQIWQKIEAQYNADVIIAQNTKCDREKAAWDEQNKTPPDFLIVADTQWKPIYGCP